MMYTKMDKEKSEGETWNARQDGDVFFFVHS